MSTSTESVLTNSGFQTMLDEGIVAEFRQQMRGPVLSPGDPGYDEARQVWNGMVDRRPALIARCTGVADVIDAVNFARTNNLLLSVRCGGHNVTGNAVCDGGIMIDLSPMKGIHVDPQKRTARAQGGVTWGDLDRETQLFGLAAPGGVVSTTGIAGLTLGGGLGWVRRKHGLSCDNLLSVEIVTADGQLLTASADENADLFWGVRGGGGNFGIVTSFEYQLHPVGPLVMLCNVFYPYEQAKEVMTAWREFMATASDEVSSQYLVWSVPVNDHLPQDLWGKPVVGVGAMYAGDPVEGERLLQPLRTIVEPVLDMSGHIPYRVVQTLFDPFFPTGGYYYLKSTDLVSLDDEVIDAILARAGDRPTPETLLVIWSYGGAISRVGVEETAFASRNIPYLYSVDMAWHDPQDAERCITWARDYVATLRPHSSGGLYANFTGDQERAQNLYGPNHARLVELKNKYDPTNLFRMNQNIQPTV
jgi:FAD/FMN-containing dehydrogenase